MLQMMKNLVREEEGQAMTEYGLIIGLVAVLLVTALTMLKDEIAYVFQEINDAIE
jgi:pilus assembly protein Flp/PilA